MWERERKKMRILLGQLFWNSFELNNPQARVASFTKSKRMSNLLTVAEICWQLEYNSKKQIQEHACSIDDKSSNVHFFPLFSGLLIQKKNPDPKILILTRHFILRHCTRWSFLSTLHRSGLMKIYMVQVTSVSHLCSLCLFPNALHCVGALRELQVWQWAERNRNSLSHTHKHTNTLTQCADKHYRQTKPSISAHLHGAVAFLLSPLEWNYCDRVRI